jgi:hypothetical protein
MLSACVQIGMAFIRLVPEGVHRSATYIGFLRLQQTELN